MKKSSNRGALGDIGNLVAAHTTKCVVRKQAEGAENQVVGGKKSITVVDRPVKSITVADRPVRRQSAATLAQNQYLPQAEEEHCQWGANQRRTMHASKREKPDSVPCPRRIITRSRAAMLKWNLLKIDENEPMIVDSAIDHKEDKDEICEMEIDEAENPVPRIDEENPVPNIDEGDEGNPLVVAEYIEDMSRFYCETEVLSCVPPDYMSRQTDINHIMRAVVVDWIVEVHSEHGLMPETLFLAVNIMDRYLSSQRDITQRNEMQLVGITAMLVASKYEDPVGLCVQDFLNNSNPLYKVNDVLQMESSMLRTLQFHICVPTPYVFLNRFLKAAQADTLLEMVSFFLVELCLVEYDTLKYPPSMLAASAVYTGQQILRRFPPWNRTMERYTAYTEDQLQECSKLMVSFHQNSGSGMLKAVHKKYSRKEFSPVAKWNRPD